MAFRIHVVLPFSGTVPNRLEYNLAPAAGVRVLIQTETYRLIPAVLLLIMVPAAPELSRKNDSDSVLACAAHI